MTDSDDSQEPEPHHSLRERIHDRLVAAELAADGAAGFGAGTELVEATDAAIHPEHATEPENEEEKSSP
ncbi:MAG: hypothetical protein ACR2GX_02535 [Candidatus Dormibacteria bacterium]